MKTKTCWRHNRQLEGNACGECTAETKRAEAAFRAATKSDLVQLCQQAFGPALAYRVSDLERITHERKFHALMAESKAASDAMARLPPTSTRHDAERWLEANQRWEACQAKLDKLLGIAP